jgi:hypothetical protein
MKAIRFCLCLGAAAALSIAGAPTAQMPAYTQAGPVPPAILAAKTIFVSNAGADAGLFPEVFSGAGLSSEPFSGDPDRAYTEFYSALKTTGDYTLVDDPGQADLVLEIRLTAPYGPTNPNRQNGAPDPLPMFRLVVYQRSTHFVLWTVTHSIDFAYLRRTHDKNFDQSLLALLNQFLQIAGKPPAVAH